MKIHQRTPEKIDTCIEKALVKVGKRAFLSSMPKAEIRNHIYDADTVFLAQEDNQIVGYGGANYSQNEVYLAGSFIDPSFHGGGRYRALTKRRIQRGLSETEDTLVETYTQNPRVHNGVLNTLSTLVLEEAVRFSTHRPERVRERYGRQLAPLPETLPPLYEALNIEAGDAYHLRFTVTP